MESLGARGQADTYTETICGKYENDVSQDESGVVVTSQNGRVAENNEASTATGYAEALTSVPGTNILSAWAGSTVASMPQVNDKVQYKVNSDDGRISATVLGRAEKVSGRNQSWVSIEECDTCSKVAYILVE